METLLPSLPDLQTSFLIYHWLENEQVFKTSTVSVEGRLKPKATQWDNVLQI